MDAFAPVAFAGLRELPDTLASRSIFVRMKRRAPDEYVEPFRHRYQFSKRDGWREGMRILGEAAPREAAGKHFATFMGTRYPTPGGSDDDVEARIRDMN